MLREKFVPTPKRYILIQKMFKNSQKPGESTEICIRKRRALKAQLPYKNIPEGMCLNIVYAALHEDIMRHMRREAFTSFAQRIELVRD